MNSFHIDTRPLSSPRAVYIGLAPTWLGKNVSFCRFCNIRIVFDSSTHFFLMCCIQFTLDQNVKGRGSLE